MYQTGILSQNVRQAFEVEDICHDIFRSKSL